MYEEFLTFAQETARKAGAILKENFGKLDPAQVQLKGPRDLVTEIDKKVEKFYAEEIKKRFPEHGIIGEEGTAEGTEREYLWIIDPLDGTKNYASENPFFCTMLCLLRDKKPVVSVIFEPITGHLYHAVDGGGAFKDDEPIHVSKQDDIRKAMLLYCHAPDDDSIREAERYVVELKIAARDASRLRSAGCEMAMIAKGVCDAYLMNKLPLWDMAAGALLVREAGGKATDFKGKDWEPDDANIMVSNGTKLHEEVIEIFRKATVT